MKLKKTINILALLVLLFGVNSCKKAVVIEVPVSPYTSALISYKVPGDPGSNASQEELALFAWKEFFALNWQASWDKDMNRGTPDTTWVLKNTGKSPNLTVWETYIHRTELRPANGKRYETNLNTGKPYYTFINPVDTKSNDINLSNFWVNLDEDNEIGSCYVFAYDELQVMYMAKSNLIEYNYVRNNFPDDALLFRAGKRGADTAYLKAISQGQSCNSDTASHVICLPCGDESGEGAIEIKTAWRKLTSADSINRFLIREAVYYTYNEKGGEAIAQKDTFGLIGLHIIHKTKNYPDFVFASWEQVDVRKDAMKTIGLDQEKIDTNIPTPVIGRTIPDTIMMVNDSIKNLITTENAQSVWQYYQLIGVQGTPIDYNERATDPNYFMANYVIESDSLLTFFHGSFGDPFNEKIKNVIYNGQSFNMGGCQGCHGQAQQGGTDFSFLLDFGAGKPVPTPDGYLTFQVAKDSAHTPTTGSQLRSFIKKYTLK